MPRVCPPLFALVPLLMRYFTSELAWVLRKFISMQMDVDKSDVGSTSSSRAGSGAVPSELHFKKAPIQVRLLDTIVRFKFIQPMIQVPTCGYCTSPAHLALNCPVKPTPTLDSGSTVAFKDKTVHLIDDPIEFPSKENKEPKESRKVSFRFRRLYFFPHRTQLL